MFGTTTWLPILGTFFTLASVSVARVEIRVNLLPRPSPIPRTYMVEVAEGHNIESFYSNLRAEDIKFTPALNITSSLFNGTSFTLDDSSHSNAITRRVASLHAVKSFWPVRSVQVRDPTPPFDGEALTTPSPIYRRQLTNTTAPANLFSFSNGSYSPHVMTQIDKLRAKGLTGKGIKIAVIDTGIDYRHPALGGCFGKGCLVGYGYDYYGLLGEDADPFDECNGHGTHVAGIIAAQPNPLGFTGAAPGVTLGAYKALTCAGSSREDVLVAAFNRAFDDGSHIINFSASLQFDWSDHPLSVAVQRIVDKGVPCITSPGNNGYRGLWGSGAPAVGRGVAAVANFINNEYPSIHSAASYTVDGQDRQSAVPFSWHPGNPALPTISMPLWASSNNTAEEEDACNPIVGNVPDLSKHIVLVRDSNLPASEFVTCKIVNKITNLVERGAEYIIVYSLNNTTFTIDASFPRYIMGIGMVSGAQGEEWVRQLNAGQAVTVHLEDPKTARQVVYSPKNTNEGGLISTKSSWGLSWELEVKPQFGAPGQNILSTYPTARGSYKILSGTSMSTPLVAGVYALLAEARGTTDPKLLESLLSSTAKPANWYDGAFVSADSLAPVPQQGAGMIQAYDAAFSTTLLNVSSLAFNDSDHHVTQASFTITNLASHSVTYSLSHQNAGTVYASATSFNSSPSEFVIQGFPQSTTPHSATIRFSSSSITIPPNSNQTITLFPTPPSSPEVDPGRIPVYSGYILLTPTTTTSPPDPSPNQTTQGEGILRIPYAGVAVSMRSLPILSRDPTLFSLASWSERDRPVRTPNTTFTIPYPDLSVKPNQGQYPDSGIPYPTAFFSRVLGTAYMRLDIIPLEIFATHNTSSYPSILNITQVVLGVKTAGMAEGYPLAYYPGRGFTEDPFTGRLADGSVVPEGRYQFIMRALRIFGDRSKAEDYDSLTLPAFELRYRK